MKPLTTTDPLGRASIGAVRQYLAQAEFEGLDIAAILPQVALDPALLADDNGQIDGLTFQALIEKLLQYSLNPAFGLHSARFVRPESYSILGQITFNCETFGEVLSKIQPFEAIVGDMGVTELTYNRPVHGKHTTTVQWHCNYTHPAVVQQMVDNVLASWLTFTRQLIGQQHKPLKLLLRRAPPSLSMQWQYQSLFDCAIAYRQRMDGFVIDNSLLAIPLTQANRQLLPTLEKQAQQQLNAIGGLGSMTQKVAFLVKTHLPRGLPTLQIIASELNLSEKTLQRRLKAENTSYLKILDQVRLTLCQQLLAMPGLNLNTVSELSGFREPRSFYRWYKQRTGVTPRNGSFSA